MYLNIIGQCQHAKTQIDCYDRIDYINCLASSVG